MTIGFPSTPSVDQVHTSGGRTWVWTGTTWDIAPWSGGVPVSSDTLTTKGDLVVRDSSGPVRLGVGDPGDSPVADPSQPTGMKWAHPFHLAPLYPPAVGDWFAPPYATSFANATTLSQLMYVPIWIPEDVSEINGLAMESTGNAVGGFARVGLYLPHPTTGRPNALVVDAGALSADALGIKPFDIPATAVTPNSLAYVGVVSQTVTFAMKFITGEWLKAMGLPTATLFDLFRGTSAFAFYEAGVTGALPSVATPLSSYNTAAQPIVAMRRSA